MVAQRIINRILLTALQHQIRPLFKGSAGFCIQHVPADQQKVRRQFLYRLQEPFISAPVFLVVQIRQKDNAAVFFQLVRPESINPCDKPVAVPDHYPEKKEDKAHKQYK